MRITFWDKLAISVSTLNVAVLVVANSMGNTDVVARCDRVAWLCVALWCFAFQMRR